MDEWTKIENKRRLEYCDFCTIHINKRSLAIPMKYFSKENESVNIYFNKEKELFAIKPCKKNKGSYKLIKTSSLRYHVACGSLKNELELIPGRYKINWDGEMCIISLKDKIDYYNMRE